jgi:hypothetical protein
MRLSNIPANSFEASTLSIPLAESGDRRLLEKRLRDPEVMLTMDERAYLAARPSKRKQGRPRLSDVVKLWIATSVIRHQFVNGMGADDAAEKVAQEEGRDKADRAAPCALRQGLRSRRVVGKSLRTGAALFGGWQS